MKAADKQRPFDLNAVDEVPRAFDKNGTMNYAKALKLGSLKSWQRRAL